MEQSLLGDALTGVLVLAIVWGAPALYMRHVEGQASISQLTRAVGVSVLTSGLIFFLLGRFGTGPSTLVVVLAMSLLSAVASVLSAELTLARPARRMNVHLDSATGGDLDKLANVDLRGEGGALARVFALLRRLRGTVMDVQIGAQDLFGAGEAILAALAQQASGATAQSVAIAETSATVEQVKASAQQAAQLADAVATTALKADRIATEGVAAVQDATAGMAHIREKVDSIADQILALAERSQQIGEIIAAVSDLADQSNMLALNAAIEATRAGEHGRGFAVVAQEIRVLAEQSKAATSQVRGILFEIQGATNAAVMASEQGTKGVENGTRLIDRAGGTITSLASVIEEASVSAQQIAASVRQHFIGMEQIVTAMGEISHATSGNIEAGAATELAAHALISLAERLSASVAEYWAVPSDEDLARLALSRPVTSPDAPARLVAPTVGFDFAASF
jgi:methyl-accepting chemotaxis protein